MPTATLREPLCRLLQRLERRWGCPPVTGPGDELARRTELAIRRASEFLVARQDGDGAWRGPGDDDFANGHALTAHVLRALRAVPQPAVVGDAIARGLDFVETICPGPGDAVDPGSPPLPYPVTAAAGALSLLAGSKRRRRDELLPPLVRYLREAQYDERAGYRPDGVAYGGFGYQPARAWDDHQERVPELHYPHLSASIFAIEALAVCGHPEAREPLDRARAFVERCQNFVEGDGDAGDGGFVFSPAIASLNKAGAEPGSPTGFRSYGTMTANGLRLLALLGYGREHPRFRAAAGWLQREYRADAVPGSFADGGDQARASVWYYHAWTVTQALDLLGQPTVRTARGEVHWARELAAQLVERQLPDGAWRNDAPARKENVLPVADLHALPALAICQRYLAEPPSA